MIQIGIDYYPEHWERPLWEEDADRMAALGVHVVRMAEFAWSQLEPREGEFSFGWLDDAIETFARRGIRVLLGTPTNCPPLWLYQRYPETVHCGRNGQPDALGIRGHRCIMSPVFRRFAEHIIRELARRYAGRAEVAGWQLDNELERSHCSCPVCRAGFRDFLRRKYGTLDAVNRAWGNRVWSGELSDWEQLQPLLGDYNSAWYNPAWLLDCERYATECTNDYVRFQRDIIRQYDPKAVITTNACFSPRQPDFHAMFAELDVASYDNYPPIRIPEEPEALYSNAFTLDFIRGFKRKNFWILEQLGGPGGCWSPIAPAMEPGMLEGYALQAVAHGAELVSFFRWRTACTGAEMFCHGLLDHSNQPNRRLAELERLSKRLAALPELDRTTLKSPVAMLYACQQEDSLRNQPQGSHYSYWEQLQLYHQACMRFGVNVDVIQEREAIAGYRVVIVVAHFLTEPAVVANLEAFARQGGTVIVTNRSGVKDQNGNCIPGQSLPTLLRPLCGCRVTEYDAIGERRQLLRTIDGKEYRISGWCDLLAPDTAECWACYGDRFYAGTPAITCNRFGAGTVYYVGTVGEKALYCDLLGQVFREAQLPTLECLPDGVECTTRTGAGGTYRFLFNNTLRSRTVSVLGETRTLQPMEVWIQTEAEQ